MPIYVSSHLSQINGPKSNLTMEVYVQYTIIIFDTFIIIVVSSFDRAMPFTTRLVPHTASVWH